MVVLPRINYIKCKNNGETYKMYYTSWGNQEDAKNTLICIHGLNRNSRDWDYVGQYFAKLGYYIIAPDIVGRGNSDYLNNYEGYTIPFYSIDIFTMIKTLGLTNIDFLGTSMGGLIGMAIASSEYNPINKLILNDIGAEIELTGLQRIFSYSDEHIDYENYVNAKDYLIKTSREFGDLPDSVWEEFARNSLQKNDNGKYDQKRDININRAFTKDIPLKENLPLWDYWKKVSIPTLIIRGELSDLLSVSTVEKMKSINLKTQSIEIKNTGHAPFLYSSEHMQILHDFLKNHSQ